MRKLQARIGPWHDKGRRGDLTAPSLEGAKNPCDHAVTICTAAQLLDAALRVGGGHLAVMGRGSRR